MVSEVLVRHGRKIFRSGLGHKQHQRHFQLERKLQVQRRDIDRDKTDSFTVHLGTLAELLDTAWTALRQSRQKGWAVTSRVERLQPVWKGSPGRIDRRGAE